MSLLALVGSSAALAQTSPSPDRSINAAEQTAVIATLSEQLKSHYVFPDVAARTAAALSSKAAHGDYRNANTTTAFAEALSKDLKSIGKDGHFRVKFAPGFPLSSQPKDKAAIARQLAELRPAMASESYGISRVQMLPGNVSYIDLRGFGPVEIVGAAFDSAVSLVAGTSALILDLRQNGGGEPDGVAYLLSHFFAEGDVRHLNDIYNRPDDSTHQYWTVPSAMPRFTGPIYVLTSHETFSGGEECAYDLKTQKRATLVGETTGGGANPGDYLSIGHSFIAFVPTSRAINPITKTNWEHVGVKPDVAVPASSAMKVAYVTILNDLTKKSKNPDEQAGLKDILARVESDKFQLPAYYPRH
ncbi:MAG: S41 family peptidase [Rhodanobacter sp.]